MKLSLRWKIVGGFGLLLILIAVLGWVTVSLFRSLQSVEERVFDEAIPQLVAVDELVRSYTAQSAAVSGYLISSQGALLDEYRQEVAVATVWENEARKSFSGSDERRLLGELVETGASFQRLVDRRVIPLRERGKRSQAFQVLSQRGNPLIARAEAVGDLLRSSQDQKVAALESEVLARSNRALITLLGVIVGALGIGLVVAIHLPRRLVGDLSTLVSAVRAVGTGDFDQRMQIRSGDEVEELAVRFTEMQAGLKRLNQLALQEHELEIAASIQKNLLQRSLPESEGARVVPLQRQANLVGGDWYDVALEGRMLTVAVGDCSGKGIGAALMATVALSVLRAERRLGAGPATVVERTNKALRETTTTDAFTTLVYSTLDVRSGEVRWLNMGHPSPFVLRAATDGSISRGFFLEGPRNRALGWFDDPGLSETVMVLEPGDRLVLFTDGFIEAKSPDGEVFGDQRLAEAMVRLGSLRGDAFVDAVVEEVERFSAGKLDDDLTMLVTEYQGVTAAPDELAVEPGERTWHSRR